MSNWNPKRFWKQVTVADAETGFAVLLDRRPVKTPAKVPMVVPTRALAQAIAAEWDAQQGLVNAASMPVTRAANAAIDKVRPQHAEVAALIADYGGTDLLCYRAVAPQELVARQAASWDPLLDWAAATLEVRLATTQGVVPVAQSAEAVAALHARVVAMTEFELSALHDLVGITGSLVLGLAVTLGHLTADQAWALARIDEDWQIAHWGGDEEAAAEAALKYEALRAAERFWRLTHG